MIDSRIAKYLLTIVEAEGVVLQEPRFEGGMPVCRITAPDGTDAVVKRCASREAFFSEQVVLRCLNQEDFPAPELFYADADTLTLFLQWCRGTPLIQILESCNKPEKAKASAAIARALARLEALFSRNANRLLSSLSNITPPAEGMADRFQTRMMGWYRRVTDHLGYTIGSEEEDLLLDITDLHAQMMAEYSQTLGLLDCASDDVLVCGEKVIFLDFEYIGYDWPDARLYGLCRELFDREDETARSQVTQAYIGAQEEHGHFFKEDDVVSRVLAIADHNHLGRTAYLARIDWTGDEDGHTGPETAKQRLEESVDSLFRHRKGWFPGANRSFSDLLTAYHLDEYRS